MPLDLPFADLTALIQTQPTAAQPDSGAGRDSGDGSFSRLVAASPEQRETRAAETGTRQPAAHAAHDAKRNGAERRTHHRTAASRMTGRAYYDAAPFTVAVPAGPRFDDGAIGQAPAAPADKTDATGDAPAGGAATKALVPASDIQAGTGGAPPRGTTPRAASGLGASESGDDASVEAGIGISLALSPAAAAAPPIPAPSAAAIGPLSSDLSAAGHSGAATVSAAAASAAASPGGRDNTAPGGIQVREIAPDAADPAALAQAAPDGLPRAGQLAGAETAGTATDKAAERAANEAAIGDAGDAGGTGQAAAAQSTPLEANATTPVAVTAASGPGDTGAGDLGAGDLDAGDLGADAEGQKDRSAGSARDGMAGILAGLPGNSGSANPGSVSGGTAATDFAQLVAAPTAPAGAPAASDAAAASRTPPALPLLPAEQVAAVLGKLDSGAKSFAIDLHPERLGAVTVKLDLDQKGRARATFTADRPETLALLRQDSHHLVRALDAAGIKTEPGGLSFALKDQNGGQAQERRAPGAAPRSPGGEAPAPEGSLAQVRGPVAGATPSRLCDLHA